MSNDSVLEIVAYGAWNGGTVVDNSIYEQKNLQFKGGIPVNNKTIEERMGVRTRKVADSDERIGVTALQDLFENNDIDLSRVKLVIGATNVGDDKYDPGPLIKYPYETIRKHCPDALVFDLYAGCPGFNVSVELAFMLSLTGFLDPQDLSIVIGAENIHRAQSFQPDDTANIIFGDDSLATALETKSNVKQTGRYSRHSAIEFSKSGSPVTEIARTIFEINAGNKIDGIIIDNQLGNLIYRVPATSARVQHALAELMYPEQATDGMFGRFKEAFKFYDRKIRSFAYDIMSLDGDPQHVDKIARAMESLCSVFLKIDRIHYSMLDVERSMFNVH